MAKTPAKRKEATEPKKMGRPSSFSDRLVERLLQLAKDGATDAEMAKAAGIGLATFKAWKGRHADFRAALKSAKDIADEFVEASLYRRATGYSHRAIKFFCHEGRITSQTYTERYPPDTTAGIFWLKNRQPEKWRDTRNHEITGKDGGPITTRPATPGEIADEITKELVDAGHAPPSETFC